MLINGSRILKCKLNKLLNFKDMCIILLEIVIVGEIGRNINNLLIENFSRFHWFVRLTIMYTIYIIPCCLLNIKKIVKLIKNINSAKG